MPQQVLPARAAKWRQYLHPALHDSLRSSIRFFLFFILFFYFFIFGISWIETIKKNAIARLVAARKSSLVMSEWEAKVSNIGRVFQKLPHMADRPRRRAIILCPPGLAA